jgi:hypothetical protein
VVLRRPLEVDDNAALTAAATGDPSTPSSARAVRRNGPAAGEQSGGASPAAPTSRASSLPPPRPALRRDAEGQQ